MSTSVPSGEPLCIAVRAYVCRAENALQSVKNTQPKQTAQKLTAKPSEWVVIFDTETTTDASQKLRFGTYQVRKGNNVIEIGIFYAPDGLKKSEIQTLKRYTDKNKITLRTVEEFIDKIFYGVGFAYRATIVGFNLPFDISRLAIDHAPARVSRFNKIMRGGFSFKLSENSQNPRVQIKHISSRDAFIQFAAVKGQRTTRGNRKKGRYKPVRRGYFIDVKTLAAALTSQSYSLASLAQAMGVSAQKHKTDDHGRTLTADYIAYALQDTQTTWECFKSLRSLYAVHGLKLTPAHSIHSEASLGKAYLRDMGIQPWQKMQPDFPPDMLGIIMSTYYGGRSEIHMRRQATQILYCDFLSMYPTVCTLMGLWRFVTAQGMTWQDSTGETQTLLEEITIECLQRPETWKNLTTLVQVMPDSDIFPVRAKYHGDSQYTIGTNYLTSHTPLWFTLADCISSKLLTGRTPKVIQAISFLPDQIQDGLKSVDIAGNPAYRVAPMEGDFFKRVIDLRSAVKKQTKAASGDEKAALESQQLALKILANATSYGIFVELNVEEEKQPQNLLCYGPSGKAIPVSKKKFEATGSFFHPLLATLITGAARLMLAITETLSIDAGLDWAFCDTDSMALAKPEAINAKEFYIRAQRVQEWFTPLNPYADKAPLLKVEDYNFSLSNKGQLEPLFCYAISSKRYALFNRCDNGKLALRKVSAHGLGHLIAPYHRNNQSDLEDARPWQQDLWLEIIQADLDNRLPDYSKLENFDMPAVSRYGATTPMLEKWFSKYNANKAYYNRVRPFNFLLAMQPKSHLKSIKPVSPFDKDPAKAISKCFDRVSGNKISKGQLKTNLDALAQYHLHPETKFLNGNYLDKGYTQRRHIVVKSIQHIGKEANKWEEQFFTGFNPDAQIEYGMCNEQRNGMLEAVLQAIEKYGVAAMASGSKLSQRHVLNIYKRNTKISENVLKKLFSALEPLREMDNKEKKLRTEIGRVMKEKDISIRQLALRIGIDPSNLGKIISGQRNNSKQLKKIYEYL